uniref:Uncharacterized protein n=1 Tax=Setaria italica TaxID=4555 RepID=K3Y4L7_SETIT
MKKFGSLLHRTTFHSYLIEIPLICSSRLHGLTVGYIEI